KQSPRNIVFIKILLVNMNHFQAGQTNIPGVLSTVAINKPSCRKKLHLSIDLQFQLLIFPNYLPKNQRKFIMATGKIYAFFVVLAMLFWNPLTYYLLYSNTPVFQFRWMFMLFSIAFLCGLVLLYLFHKSRVHPKLKNPLL